MNAIVDGAVVAVPDGLMPELPAGEPGAFETLLWRGGELVFAAPHWARFDAGCRWHGFLPPVNEDRLECEVRSLAASNGIITGVVRIAAWRVGPNRATWRIDVGAPRPHMARAEFAIGWGAVLPPGSEERAYKHLNRAQWGDALRATRRAGFDEAILSDGAGRVVEGCVSNVFVVRDGLLLTPALECGPLPGIMRAQVLEVARAHHLEAREAIIAVSHLESASEVWLTNSLIGIRPVSHLAGRALPVRRPMLERLARAWQDSFGWHPIVVTPVASR